MVQFLKVEYDVSHNKPPPSLDELPLIVQLAKVAEEPEQYTPPPPLPW
jgi:hypothetical protein